MRPEWESVRARIARPRPLSGHLGLPRLSQVGQPSLGCLCFGRRGPGTLNVALGPGAGLGFRRRKQGCVGASATAWIALTSNKSA